MSSEQLNESNPPSVSRTTVSLQSLLKPWSRSYTRNWIGGVCGGMASCTGIPVAVWRVLFILLSGLYGLGALGYAVLWAIIPGEAEQPGQPRVKAMFRSVDWTAFLLTTVLSFIGYYLTLSPDITLEDSGELAVGSFYAGVPHPPGYPIWTLYTWLFTVLIPVSNIAWRVALSSAVAAALASGLIALMISRGSSMMLEGIEEFRALPKRLENWICVLCGYVGGMLLAFNGTIWSQAVIVEVYTLSVLSLVAVLVLLFRWLYAPQQRRYLYWSFFVFGICFTNHQTLIVAAMGIEVLILMADPKLGRDLFLGNSVVYIIGLVLKAQGLMVNLENNLPMFVIFNVVGLASIGVFGWLWAKTGAVLSEWKAVVFLGLFWLAGSGFYFYMPLASMTNPPMNWGYPRTWDGFKHALSRGQYEQANPTTGLWRFLNQIRIYYEGARNEFGTILLMVGLLPFAFYSKMKQRERSWILGLTAIYIFLAFLLLILLNPTPDRQSRELNRVFFTSSHVIIAMAIGYGLMLISALIVTQYERVRQFLMWGGSAASGIGLYYVIKTMEETEYPYLRMAAWLGFLLPVVFTAFVLIRRDQAPRMKWIFVLYAIIPLQSICAHWADNEERHHLFGYWFGHDMFKPPYQDGAGQPIYPEMARDAILFGGTDPGRFNPTYMIFCESIIDPEDRRDPEFDRRDVYLITQNALADGTYLSYIRAHYNRSTQYDPPFFQEMLGGAQNLALGRTNLLARLFRPVDDYFLEMGDRKEKERRTYTSWFEPEHFLNPSSLAAKLRGQSQANLSSYLLSQFSEKTRSFIDSGTSDDQFTDALAEDLNRLLDGDILYTPARFEGIDLSERTLRFIRQNPQSHTKVRLNRLLLEEAFPGEIQASIGGVYPDLEIYTPTVLDSQRAFGTYMNDANQRIQLGQLRHGEDVSFSANGEIHVAGQVAVMAINALLTKVIFDQNPAHEFYVEESFPLDWMYPHLTPYGIIMKLNREPVAEITQEMIDKDHAFWRQYSNRLIGDWIDYDTTIAEVCEFALRLYLQHHYDGFTGDRKFIRDGNAQKSFSKLRSSLGGLYGWRINNAKTTEEQNRMIREATFAYKQAFAYCPYSPEALYRFVNLLISMGRLNDALLLAQTSLQFDLENANVLDLVEQLQGLLGQQMVISNSVAQIEDLTRQFETNKTNTQLAFNLVAAHIAMGRTNEGLKVLDDLVSHPDADATALLSVANAYQQLGVGDRLEKVFLRVIQIIPDNPEAWYDLAAIQGILGKTNEAIQSLQTCIQLSNARLSVNPRAENLHQQAGTDPRFAHIRFMPEFRQLFE